MPNDREKLLKIMNNLESDYRRGKISAEKYSYFRSKYEDKLNSIDAEAATRKIRSMQGKPSTSNKKKKSYKKKGSKPTRNKKQEQDLVQKYIINPKKGDATYDKKKKEPMDNGTFKLILLLVLVIGFTAGIAYGIFNFDFETVSETATVAIVEDTAFPEVKEVITKNVTTTDDSDNNESSSADDTVEEYTETDTTASDTSSNDQSESYSTQSESTTTYSESSTESYSEPSQSTESSSSSSEGSEE